tara:strand:- start:3265 stop:3645 length:381 start_codon:yes stop_codon:yes gene_type:complete
MGNEIASTRIFFDKQNLRLIAVGMTEVALGNRVYDSTKAIGIVELASTYLREETLLQVISVIKKKEVEDNQTRFARDYEAATRGGHVSNFGLPLGSDNDKKKWLRLLSQLEARVRTLKTVGVSNER